MDWGTGGLGAKSAGTGVSPSGAPFQDRLGDWGTGGLGDEGTGGLGDWGTGGLVQTLSTIHQSPSTIHHPPSTPKA